MTDHVPEVTPPHRDSEEPPDPAGKSERPRRTSLVFANLPGILDAHRRWWESKGSEGERANLEQGFLYQAQLSRVQLAEANAQQAHLGEANLTEADLRQANLAGATLEHADLTGADLGGANLAGADLSGADLSGAVLREADLHDANLAGAKGVSVAQLAGANLAGATLPAEVREFGELQVVEESSKYARMVLLTTLLACAYSWLAIVTTTDVHLITNSTSSPLPIFRTGIPIVVFYWAVPVLILAFYVELHRYMRRVCTQLAKLPAVFRSTRHRLSGSSGSSHA